MFRPARLDYYERSIKPFLILKVTELNYVICGKRNAVARGRAAAQGLRNVHGRKERSSCRSHVRHDRVDKLLESAFGWDAQGEGGQTIDYDAPCAHLLYQQAHFVQITVGQKLYWGGVIDAELVLGFCL